MITLSLRQRAIGRRFRVVREALQFADWRAQDWPRGHDYRPLDKILQFPNIARPTMSPDRLHDLVGNLVDYFVHPSGERSNEVPNKLRDVFGAFPQRRGCDGEH